MITMTRNLSELTEKIEIAICECDEPIKLTISEDGVFYLNHVVVGSLNDATREELELVAAQYNVEVV